jgi:hypothetical protein
MGGTGTGSCRMVLSREFQCWQKATGASTFLLRLRHAHSGGPPHDKILEAIRLFGERVLPYV